MGNNTSSMPLRRPSLSRDHTKPIVSHHERSSIDHGAQPSNPINIRSKAGSIKRRLSHSGTKEQSKNHHYQQQSTPQIKDSNEKNKPIRKTPTPNIFLDNLVDTDYFNSKPVDGRDRRDSENSNTDPTNVLNGDEIFDDDDGYGIDEDLASTGISLESENIKTVLIKFYNTNSLIRDDRIFVIGSFNRWSKKLELEPEVSRDGYVLYFKNTIKLPVGVYRVKFIVNGDIRYSDHLPIATDKSGNVVNWFEVEDTINDFCEAGVIEKHKIINNKRKSSTSVVHDSELSLPLTPSYISHGLPTPPIREVLNYSSEVPKVFQIAYSADELLPADEEFLHKHPIPDLPVYLNNNYLNKHFSTHHNDQSDDTANLSKYHSVRGLNSHIIPHVNLNHLLTSNIKNNVLSAACTTRYSGKFITQIMYSPSDYDL